MGFYYYYYFFTGLISNDYSLICSFLGYSNSFSYSYSYSSSDESSLNSFLLGCFVYFFLIIYLSSKGIS